MSRPHDRERPATEPDHKRRSPEVSAPQEQQAELEALRKAVGNSAMSRMLDAKTSQTIEAKLGGGRPLSEVASTQRSPGTADADGAPIGDVRLHEDATAAALSKQLGAVAFTFGKDIFLAGDAPALDSPEGQRVLRHELTHVRQQQTSGATRPRRVSSPNSPAEHEAARIGDSPGPSSNTAAPGAVHRQEEEEEEMLQPMPAETVHRQEEEEEEEMLQPMPAETVHRQEEEEEMLQPMPAETVHRQEEKTAVNPALAAIFEATVISKISEAAHFMSMDPPLAEEAERLLLGAGDGLRALADSYGDSDPLLAANLKAAKGSIVSITNMLAPLVGPATTKQAFSGNFRRLQRQVDQIAPTLH